LLAVEPPERSTERWIARSWIGLTNRAIAGQLRISEATVKTHLVHVFAKLGVDDRTAAVTAALEWGLLQLHR
jgi:DNA-binding NarL/FixJ family response regulator